MNLKVFLHYSKDHQLNIRYFSLDEIDLDVHFTVNKIKDILYRSTYLAVEYCDNTEISFDPLDHEFTFNYDSKLKVQVVISGLYMNGLSKLR